VILKLGLEITKEIVEVLCNHPDLLEEIGFHDQNHKLILLKKIVFGFVSIKGKHLCKSVNIEENSLLRHKKTKEILFSHE